MHDRHAGIGAFGNSRVDPDNGFTDKFAIALIGLEFFQNFVADPGALIEKGRNDPLYLQPRIDFVLYHLDSIKEVFQSIIGIRVGLAGYQDFAGKRKHVDGEQGKARGGYP